VAVLGWNPNIFWIMSAGFALIRMRTDGQYAYSGGRIDKLHSPAPDYPFQPGLASALQYGFVGVNTVGSPDGFGRVVGRQNFQSQLADQALCVDFTVLGSHAAELRHAAPANHDGAGFGRFRMRRLPKGLVKDFFTERMAVVGCPAFTDAKALDRKNGRD